MLSYGFAHVVQFQGFHVKAKFSNLFYLYNITVSRIYDLECFAVTDFDIVHHETSLPLQHVICITKNGKDLTVTALETDQD